MPPVEAWEKVYINAEDYAEDAHAFINCTACHGGQPVDDMAAAHTDLVADPAADPEASCGTCHPDIAPHAAESLHYSLAGYDTVLYARSTPDNHETLEYMESYHCDSCHAACGDCHISQPDSVGGGLLEGHTYVRTPPMSRTCTGCHGSRVKNEYYGLNEGVTGDVHLRQARLLCTDCHTSDAMHGIGETAGAEHRYDGAQQPTCESCHADVVGANSDIMSHQIHGTEILSCQACHSVAYTNCTNCHVDRTEDDVPYYSVEEHSLGFYLGQNVLRDSDRPYRYVPVRHVPVDPDSFSAYGENLLNNFLNRPTWAYATPHNIQRLTPQTQSCLSCHSNDDVFLTMDKVAPAERGGANLAVIVDEAPPLPEGGIEKYLNPDRPLSPPELAEEPVEVTNNPSYWAVQSGVGQPPAEEPADEDQEPVEEAEEPAEPSADEEAAAEDAAEDEPAPDHATPDEEAASNQSSANPSYWAQQSQEEE